jgi:hypothetical protein
MGVIKRGGYLFITWIGDHDPPHVHVYKDGKLITKWALKEKYSMYGIASRRIQRLIKELQAEGRL